MTRHNIVFRFVLLCIAVFFVMFAVGALLYPYLVGLESEPALTTDDFFMYRSFRHAASFPYGPETMGAKILLATDEMIHLPEDAYFSKKYDYWRCREGQLPCPTVPVYRIVRGEFNIFVDGEGRIFARGHQLDSEYLRRFAFLKERLPPDRTPEGLDQLHPAYADEPCVHLKCEWW